MSYRGGQIINIAGLTPVDDPEYRYKMPAVFGKIEGSGNGIKVRFSEADHGSFLPSWESLRLSLFLFLICQYALTLSNVPSYTWSHAAQTLLHSLDCDSQHYGCCE